MKCKVNSDFFDVVDRVDRKEGDVYEVKDSDRANHLISIGKVSKVEVKKANNKADKQSPVTKKGNLKTK